MQLHEFTCIFHQTDTKTRTAALRCAGFCNLLFSRILYHEARSAVLLGLIEHAVGFSEQVLDLLRENKAVRADAAADRDLLENTGNIAQELRQQMLQLVRRQIHIEHYGKLVTADTIRAVIREILSNPVRNRAQHVVAGLMSQVVVDLMQADGIHINAGQPHIIRQLKDLEVVLVLAAAVPLHRAR